MVWTSIVHKGMGAFEWALHILLQQQKPCGLMNGFSTCDVQRYWCV